MDLQKIKELAYEQMANQYNPNSYEKGEKFHHGERTAKLALTLREHLYPDDTAHDDVLTVAAWFHDIRNGVADHWTEGTKKTRELLMPYCTADELDEICGIIAVHDDRDMTKSYSATIRLHQDADNLDHFGTFNIWRCFFYAAHNGQTLPQTIDYMINRIPKENAQYRDQLHFELCKRMFDEKAEFFRLFAERFEVEGSGEIWGAAKFLSK